KASGAGDSRKSGAGSDPVARLAAAGLAEVRKVLVGQPDWAVALLLSGHEWPWAAEFLGALPPERIRALRGLAAELSLAAKPRVREVLMGILAGKLDLAPAQTPVTRAFDAALERANSEIATLDNWKLDLS